MQTTGDRVDEGTNDLWTTLSGVLDRFKGASARGGRRRVDIDRTAAFASLARHARAEFSELLGTIDDIVAVSGGNNIHTNDGAGRA